MWEKETEKEMRLIEIQNGISINAEKIDGIKELSDGTCEVYVGTRTYLSTLPYSNLMQILKMESVVDKGTSKDEAMAETMKKVNAVLDKTGFYAG